MTCSSDFQHFVQRIAGAGLTEEDKAIAWLWYADRSTPGSEMSVSDLANELHGARLTGRINVTRLGTNLSKSASTVQGGKRGTFRMALRAKPQLDKKYSPFLKRETPAVSDEVLPRGQVAGTRPYLEGLCVQINGCYDATFYDACAVMCRRMIESLLVEAFDKAGQLAAIEHNGQIIMLDGILGQAKSGQYIRLPRGTDKVLDKIKEIGDTAAHDRFHITTKQDIEEFRSGFRRVVSQLMGLAGITP